jgi:hypothetical protein
VACHGLKRDDGNAPRLLTLQENVFEAGGTFAGAGGTTNFFTGLPAAGLGGIGTVCDSNNTCGNGQPHIGANQSFVYSAGALEWFQGINVGIGLDTNEIGATEGLTFNTLVMTLYDANGVALANFSGDAPVFIPQAFLAFQQGTGNSVFDLRLDDAQQAQYNAVMFGRDPFNTFVAINASLGCVTVFEGCGPSTDGQDTLLAFNAVPGPVVGAGIPGLMALGMFGLHFWRRRRNGAHLPA